MALSFTHLVSARDFSRADIETIFARAIEFKRDLEKADRENEPAPTYNLLSRRILFSIFHEESLRTRSTFEVAMLRLGGSCFGSQDSERFSTMYAKGESFMDTIRVLQGERPDIIVLRHPKTGMAFEAASVISKHSRRPLINAGDGNNEHPTQALIDLFPIKHLQERLGRKVRLTLVGDMKDSRTAHSLLILIATLKAEGLDLVSDTAFVSPDVMSIRHRPDVVNSFAASGINIERHESLTPAIAKQSDVIYMTRVQKERKGGIELGEHTNGASYRLGLDLVEEMPEHGIILHPLPRGEEIPVEVDENPRARYFEQAEDGIPIRMALLCLMLGL